MNAGRVLSRAGLDSDDLRAELGPIDPADMWLKPASPLLRKLWGRGIQAITLRRWIFVDPKNLGGDKRKLGLLTIHELVHARQWARLGVVGFLWSYLGDYLKGRVDGLGHRASYMQVSQEVEAREVTDRFR